jgi:imidazolonepropionase-like amidohydrolase
MPSNASVVAIAAAASLTVMTATLASQSQTIRVHANTVLDGTGKVLRNATIVVQGSKISSIETGNPANVTYNLGQLTIVPGLIDVHAHVGWHFDKDGRYAARPGSPRRKSCTPRKMRTRH